MNRHSRFFWVIFVVLFVWISPVHGEEAGVTDKTIKVGSLVPLTGPAAGLGKVIGSGLELAFRAANDAGGVNGRKFEVVLEDNAYNPKETVAGFKKLVDRDKVFGIPLCIGTPPGMAVIPLAQEEKVPTLLYAGPTTWFVPPKRYVFVVGMPYQLEIIGMMEYALQNLNAKQKKIGAMGQDDLKEVTLEAMGYVEKQYGLHIIDHQFFKRSTPDPSPQLLALKSAGVDMVVVSTNARDMALLLKKSMEINYKPIFLGISTSVDQSIFSALPPGTVDYYAGAPVAPITADLPGIKKLSELGKKYVGPDFKPAAYHLLGYVPALVFIEGVRAAGRDLTREKLINAFEDLRNVDLGGGIAPPVTYGPKIHFSANAMMVVKMNTDKKVFEIIRKMEEIKYNPYK